MLQLHDTLNFWRLHHGQSSLSLHRLYNLVIGPRTRLRDSLALRLRYKQRGLFVRKSTILGLLLSWMVIFQIFYYKVCVLFELYTRFEIFQKIVYVQEKDLSVHNVIYLINLSELVVNHLITIKDADIVGRTMSLDQRLH